jgi:hypothetical protein
MACLVSDRGLEAQAAVIMPAVIGQALRVVNGTKGPVTRARVDSYECEARDVLERPMPVLLKAFSGQRPDGERGRATGASPSAYNDPTRRAKRDRGLLTTASDELKRACPFSAVGSASASPRVFQTRAAARARGVNNPAIQRAPPLRPSAPGRRRGRSRPGRPRDKPPLRGPGLISGTRLGVCLTAGAQSSSSTHGIITARPPAFV